MWKHPTALIVATFAVTTCAGAVAGVKFSLTSNADKIAMNAGLAAIFLANLCGILVSLPYHEDRLSGQVAFLPNLPLAVIVVILRLIVLPFVGYVGVRFGILTCRTFRGA